MTHTTVLSVRGHASLTVAPDEAVVSCQLRTVGPDKAAALGTASAALEAVVAVLAGLGGTVLPSDGRRVALGWVATSVTSFAETRFDQGKHEPTPTGRVVATVDLTIRVRDLPLLDRLGDTLAGHDTVHVTHVRWLVDDDNVAWGSVRATAIAAAIQKGTDYASALGGSLTSIDQVADAGLLDGSRTADHVGFQALAASGVGFGAEGATPSLDPVPQELPAVIDARFSASVADLAGGSAHGAKRVTP
ncbi:MAG: SIMPL domain-containing protein [Jatrophihabitantaceae bacterium]